MRTLARITAAAAGSLLATLLVVAMVSAHGDEVHAPVQSGGLTEYGAAGAIAVIVAGWLAYRLRHRPGRAATHPDGADRAAPATGSGRSRASIGSTVREARTDRR